VFVALGIQHAMRMGRIILSSVACLALQYFSTLSHKSYDLRGKKLLNVKCVFSFSVQLLSEIFLILRRTERDMIKMYIGLHVKYALFLSDLKETCIFCTDFRKNTQISNFMKIRPQWEPSFSMQTDKRTDLTKLIVAFRNFANSSKEMNRLEIFQYKSSIFI
jgi:hypothetical protein